MDKRFREIIEELDATGDPKVESVVEALLRLKKTADPDDNFVHELKPALMSKARAVEVKSHPTLTLTLMTKWFYAAGGAVLALLVLVPAVLLQRNSSSLSFTALSDTSITKLASGAFGSLSASVSGSGDAVKGGAPSVDAGSRVAQEGIPAGFGGGGSGAVAGDSMIIAPDWIQTVYSYNGDGLTLDGQPRDVYRRSQSGFNASSLSQMLRSFNVGVLDLSSFGNAVLQNLSFIQNEPEGYQVFIDLQNGSVSISENWEQWQNVWTRYCIQNERGECMDMPRITLADIPSDERLIAIANDFMTAHDISLEGYGAPEVTHEWRVWYEQSPNQADYYLPDALQVVYPIEINGRPVYDEGGYKSGVRVNVNLRAMKVTGVWDLTVRKLESSSYPTTVDREAVLAYVKRGGAFYYMPEGGREVTAELGDPTEVYMRHWKYENNRSQELYVPALLFPITNTPDEAQTGRQAVVVPLIDELLIAPAPENPAGIMPLEKIAQ